MEKSFKKLIDKYGDKEIQLTENDAISTVKVKMKLEELKKKQYSDIRSKGKEEEELQWVHFVQEGGGTLGIALVGFTFALEYVGIRFLKLAGTSAGAINTLFLAAIGNKQDPKSPELYNMLTDKKRFNMRNFVDSQWWIVRKAILSLSRGMGLIKNTVITYISMLFCLLLILPLLTKFDIVPLIIYGAFLVIFLLITGVGVFFLVQLSKNNFGINPGNNFENFLINELQKLHINQQQQLDKIACGKLIFTNNKANDSNLGQLKYIGENPTLEPLEYNYAFVSTDFNNECKVVLPNEANLYFDNQAIENPAKYVRASMAIPLFFEPKILPDKIANCSRTITPACKLNWELSKGISSTRVEDIGMLMDGGSISNFPINLLHNSNIDKPRLPIIGARINDSEPKKRGLNNKMGFGDYAGGILNTIRGHEDNSFIATHPFYKKYSISNIKAYETKVNWLNFNLSEKQVDDLFMTGVKAAIKYLNNFNWSNYKNDWVK